MLRWNCFHVVYEWNSFLIIFIAIEFNDKKINDLDQFEKYDNKKNLSHSFPTRTPSPLP